MLESITSTSAGLLFLQQPYTTNICWPSLIVVAGVVSLGLGRHLRYRNFQCIARFTKPEVLRFPLRILPEALEFKGLIRSWYVDMSPI